MFACRISRQLIITWASEEARERGVLPGRHVADFRAATIPSMLRYVRAVQRAFDTGQPVAHEGSTGCFLMVPHAADVLVYRVSKALDLCGQLGEGTAEVVDLAETLEDGRDPG